MQFQHKNKIVIFYCNFNQKKKKKIDDLLESLYINRVAFYNSPIEVFESIFYSTWECEIAYQKSLCSMWGYKEHMFPDKRYRTCNESPQSPPPKSRNTSPQVP